MFTKGDKLSPLVLAYLNEIAAEPPPTHPLIFCIRDCPDGQSIRQLGVRVRQLSQLAALMGKRIRFEEDPRTDDFARSYLVTLIEDNDTTKNPL